MKTKYILRSFLFLTVAVFSHLTVAAAAVSAEVGTALFVRGAVSAQTEAGEARLLERHNSIYEHDQISTGSKSFTVLEMKDGTRITLRPDTEFVVDQYVWKDGDGKANYNLLKGGGYTRYRI
jgi:hypothetical protein